MLSTPPIKPYDIVPDIWNKSANVTVGELLANNEYRNDLQTILNTMSNKSVNNLDHITTTALTMKINVGKKVVKTIPDSGAAISVISQGLAKRLGLTIEKVEKSDLRALAGNIKTIGVVRNAPLKIATANIPIDLQVVNTTEDDFLLGMDWFNKYEVVLDTKNKEIIFKSEGNLFKTQVNSEKVKKPTCFMLVEADEIEQDIQVIPEDEWTD